MVQSFRKTFRYLASSPPSLPKTNSSGTEDDTKGEKQNDVDESESGTKQQQEQQQLLTARTDDTPVIGFDSPDCVRALSFDNEASTHKLANKVSKYSLKNMRLRSTDNKIINPSDTEGSTSTSTEKDEILDESEVSNVVANLSDRMKNIDVASSVSSSSSITDDNNDTHKNGTFNKSYPLKKIRDQILRMSATAGTLSVQFIDRTDEKCTMITKGKTSKKDNNDDDTVHCLMVELLQQIMVLGDLLSIANISTVVHSKMELNRKKYPVHLCKGKAFKYTEYSDQTGITKHKGQDTTGVRSGANSNLSNSSSPTTGTTNTDDTKGSLPFMYSVPSLTHRIRQFASERDWQVYHTPRNLLLALIGELGELAELVQFKGDTDQIQFTTKEIDKLGQELADVTIYLLRLADVSQVNLYNRLLMTQKQSKRNTESNEADDNNRVTF